MILNFNIHQFAWKHVLESYIVYSSVSSTHAAWKTIYVFSLKKSTITSVLAVTLLKYLLHSKKNPCRLRSSYRTSVYRTSTDVSWVIYPVPHLVKKAHFIHRKSYCRSKPIINIIMIATAPCFKKMMMTLKGNSTRHLAGAARDYSTMKNDNEPRSRRHNFSRKCT